MLRRVRSGQSMISEYALLLILAVTAVAAMTVYGRRALQGRIFDAQRYVIKQTATALGQPVAIEYEPYYANSSSNTDSRSAVLENVVRGQAYHNKETLTVSNTASISQQLPPSEAEQED